MEKTETLADFYKKASIGGMPIIQNGVGHFNVFRFMPFVVDPSKTLSYQRRDYFKVMLIFGNLKINYADKVIQVEKQALMFCNPQIPYSFEPFEQITDVVFCLFSHDFFYQFGGLKDYSVFLPGQANVFELSDEQAQRVLLVYDKMLEEINSNYDHKYDLLRNYVYEILHFAMKILPSNAKEKPQTNGSLRITNLFLELLERQFPIDETHRNVTLKAPSDFARQLNIHVNHLNRALKEATGKTSTQIIAERFVQEARILLLHSAWNVSEIGMALGFEDVAYFSNFFKKHTQVTPLTFRNI